MTASTGTVAPRWRDPAVPLPERVAALVADMTLEEKLAQLVGVWVGIEEGEDVAPAQHDFAEPLPPWDELTRPGLGQLTRVFGTAPVEPVAGARALARTQAALVAGSRLGIPAIAHEESLTGFTAWQATIFPTPLAWGAAFDPELVGEIAHDIGLLMRSVGIHQALSPVLDVSRDSRWGRTEETIGEDPYLVGTIAAAYTRGLEAAGIVATLKHFAGYSLSRAGRNHAPVSIGPRELADVVLPPFEMGLREGGARSVMQSYSDIDGVPPAADPALLTGLLREQWGFDGVVVSDYFGISFLETMHAVAGSPGEAAVLALRAGVDVELPTLRCYAEPLAEQVRARPELEALVDRAVERVLRQKGELGLLDEGWDPTPEVLRDREPGDDVDVDFDPPAQQVRARQLAERSVVLLHNPDGALPLRAPSSVAVVGPCADEVRALMGCYAFPNHVLLHHPGVPLGLEFPTLLAALRDELPGSTLTVEPGCPVSEADESGIAAAVAAAKTAERCIAVVGDVAGLFGRGTSGEGCDAETLALPGSQQALLDALLDAGVRPVVVVLSGRPYSLGRAADEAAAVVQAFFAGQGGAAAVAGVLSGRVNPSGRLPVQVPRGPGGQPASYLSPILAGPTEISSVDPSPRWPFGHGLSYTSFEYDDLRVDDQPAAGVREVPTDGAVRVACTVRNTGDRSGAEVVQLYLHDPVASVARPVRQLLGYARVELAAAAAARVAFDVHLDRTSFTGPDLRRIVEPGRLELQLASSSREVRLTALLDVVGEIREVGHDRVLTTPVTVEPL
ncbi:beta-glucosidase-like glycosyl hydrolase [Nocardioides thalensis]|uniref:Beta-glucosidase-like glycosyl hydrolase n=1 Tax=Nocardioides thalensis TaxID=1914755 RepID=A0A853C062_9ACTN|nr:glycoside hydrolase family 3 N-terminal domain-containing protein [Nocardioides thalensis]NYJ00591.1 beta-glucosidase-like glycosyl hydrolase [Nocardioides thalensis]